eukprot:jgi/Mesvir1/23706/Mv18655-RA.1
MHYWPITTQVPCPRVLLVQAAVPLSPLEGEEEVDPMNEEPPEEHACEGEDATKVGGDKGQAAAQGHGQEVPAVPTDAAAAPSAQNLVASPAREARVQTAPPPGEGPSVPEWIDLAPASALEPTQPIVFRSQMPVLASAVPMTATTWEETLPLEGADAAGCVLGTVVATAPMEATQPVHGWGHRGGAGGDAVQGEDRGVLAGGPAGMPADGEGDDMPADREGDDAWVASAARPLASPLSSRGQGGAGGGDGPAATAVHARAGPWGPTGASAAYDAEHASQFCPELMPLPATAVPGGAAEGGAAPGMVATAEDAAPGPPDPSPPAPRAWYSDEVCDLLASLEVTSVWSLLLAWGIAPPPPLSWSLPLDAALNRGRGVCRSPADALQGGQAGGACAAAPPCWIGYCVPAASCGGGGEGKGEGDGSDEVGPGMGLSLEASDEESGEVGSVPVSNTAASTGGPCLETPMSTGSRHVAPHGSCQLAKARVGPGHESGPGVVWAPSLPSQGLPAIAEGGHGGSAIAEDKQQGGSDALGAERGQVAGAHLGTSGKLREALMPGEADDPAMVADSSGGGGAAADNRAPAASPGGNFAVEAWEGSVAPHASDDQRGERRAENDAATRGTPVALAGARESVGEAGKDERAEHEQAEHERAGAGGSPWPLAAATRRFPSATREETANKRSTPPVHMVHSPAAVKDATMPSLAATNALATAAAVAGAQLGAAVLTAGVPISRWMGGWGASSTSGTAAVAPHEHITASAPAEKAGPDATGGASRGGATAGPPPCWEPCSQSLSQMVSATDIAGAFRVATMVAPAGDSQDAWTGGAHRLVAGLATARVPSSLDATTPVSAGARHTGERWREGGGASPAATGAAGAGRQHRPPASPMAAEAASRAHVQEVAVETEGETEADPLCSFVQGTHNTLRHSAGSQQGPHADDEGARGRGHDGDDHRGGAG